jgi:hypothetical protein
MSTFKEDLITDLDDVFLDNEEFAVDVIYNSVTFQGIFDDEFIGAVDERLAVESTAPQVQVKTSDVTGALHGETITVGSVDYKIAGIQPDGTGMTIILLSID